MDTQDIKVALAWVFMLVCFAGTVVDPLWLAPNEPRHVLILSWAALDISAVQIVIATLTRRDVNS